MSVPVSSDSLSATQRIAHWRVARRAVVLAHTYQPGPIQDVADFTGDSLDLSRRAAETDAEVIVFCGVRFMAESAKILSPHKTVLLPAASAGCPMADMVTAQALQQRKAQHPQAAVVAYVNSSAGVKAEADICCTSANAIAVVNSLEAREVLFVPDRNLGAWVAEHTDKHIISWDGFCPCHEHLKAETLQAVRKAHPGAQALVHPECPLALCQQADAVLSTAQMLRHVRETSAQEFIIGTEVGLLHQLQKENPGRHFYPLDPEALCPTMKLTTLDMLADTLEYLSNPIELDESIRCRAAAALSAMLRL